MKEQELFRYMCQHFGTDLAQRMAKLDEEYTELKEAYRNLTESNRHYTTFNEHRKNEEAFIDELADVYALVLQIAGLKHCTPSDLTKRVGDKYIHRETDPDYKHDRNELRESNPRNSQ